MNLLFLDSIDKDTYGGMEEWIRLVGAGLHRKGHNIYISGRDNSKFLKRVSADNPELKQIPLNISGDFNPVTIARIYSEIKSRQIDIILVNFNKDLRLGGLAAKLEKDCKVIWSLGLDITKNSLVHKVLTPKLVDGVIVPSNALRDQITRFDYITSNQVKVIPIGIPEANVQIEKRAARAKIIEKFGLNENTFICVTSGRFVDQKGHRHLIEAAPKIIEKCPETVFLFLGDGQLKSELQTMIRERKLEKYFVLAGMLDTNNVAEILPGCDLMIHPSVEEPFGIAILEGMRAELPVVASRVGGIPEVVVTDETALLVEPENAAEIAEAVLSLQSSEDKLRQMGQAGKTRWQNYFGYSKMIDKIESYLDSFISSEKTYGTSETART
ncbi:MAG: glycosyltransferase family 4 protein [candidate division Zixibacteria bacterium]|nr:glycosyltransferase family 4 protein [candidate division Zixibacteria bacterium]